MRFEKFIVLIVPFSCFALSLIAFNLDSFATTCPKNGDHALLALSVSLADAYSVLSGPYSRFHFNHPLPTYFYLYSFFDSVVPFSANWTGTYQCIQVLLQILFSGVSIYLSNHIFRGTFATPILFCSLVLLLPLSAFSSTWGPHTLPVPLLLLAIACSACATLLSPPLLLLSIAFIFSISNHLSGALAAVAFTGTSLTYLAVLKPKYTGRLTSLSLLLTGLSLIIAVLPVGIDLVQNGSESNPVRLFRYLTHNTQQPGHSGVLQDVLSHSILYEAPWYSSILFIIVALLILFFRRKHLKHPALLLALLAGVNFCVCVFVARSATGTPYSYLYSYSLLTPILLLCALGSTFRTKNIERYLCIPLSLGCIAFVAEFRNLEPETCKMKLNQFLYEHTQVHQTYPLVLTEARHWSVAAQVVNELNLHGVRVCVPKDWEFAFRKPFTCTEQEIKNSTQKISVGGKLQSPAETPTFTRKNYAVWVTSTERLSKQSQ